MIAISRASVRATVIAGAIVAVVALGFGLSRLPAARAERAGVIAVPVTIPEPAVLAALKSVGIDRVWCASNTIIPLTDFSRIVEVPFAEAELRVGPGDPRRTPLFEALERRLSAKGPDGSVWNLFYTPSATRDGAVLAAALRSLGVDWATSVTPSERPAVWWWSIPVCSWGLWLVLRRPRSDRLHRALLVSAWLPLLARPSPEAAVLAVVLQSASVQWASARAARSMRSLWAAAIPESVVAVAMLVLDPLSGLLVLASAALAGIVIRTRPRVDRILRRRWVHAAPRFVPLTAMSSQRQIRPVLLGLVVPVLAIALVSLVAPGRAVRGAALSGLRIERGQRLDHVDGRDLLEKHIAYQRALTWGRIGEAVWGQKTFTEAYQYVEKSGTMHRADGGGAEAAGPSGQQASQPVPLPRQALALLDEDWEFMVVSGKAEAGRGK